MENELVIKPRYTLSEELMSAISHGIGVLLAIAGMVLCIVKSASDGSAVGVVSSSLYGSFMIILYLMSTLYHSFKPNITAKKVFRVFTYIWNICTIYISNITWSFGMDFIWNSFRCCCFRNSTKLN